MKKKHQNQLIFILIILIGGILCGLIGGILLKSEQLNQLDHILLPMNDSIDLYKTFIFQFSMQMIYILGILLLGTSLLGTIFISLVLFTKGFQIGLTCMMFIYTYELKGILGIILTLIPQVILEMIPIIIIALYSIECSNHVLYAWLHSHRFNTSHEINSGLNYLIFSSISALISSYLKATLIIILIRFFNRF